MRERLICGLVAMTAALALAAPAAAHHVNVQIERDLNLPDLETSAPDLVPLLPTVSDDPGVPSAYIDRHHDAPNVLLRFDTVIANQGGTLDLWCKPCGATKKTTQMIWPGGDPPASDLPTPTELPSSANMAGNTTLLLTDTTYSFASGHNHFHFDRAARYELLIGEQSLLTDKVGFCMYDTYGGGSGEPHYFSGGVGNGLDYNWCAGGTGGDVPMARMGISPQRGDLYAAYLEDQWIDVTGAQPGTYTLRATVNPSFSLIESDIDNNVLDVPHTVPGGVVTPTSASTPVETQVKITLAGQVIGASVPSTKPGCDTVAELRTPACFETAAGGALDWGVASQPDNGGVSLSGGGLTAKATYTPDDGFVGTDTFTVRATDSRGLAGPPATITVQVGIAAPTVVVAPTVSGDPTPGSTLTAAPGSWSGDGTIATAIAWQRCAASLAPCVDVPGASGSSYAVGTADLGTRLRVRVTATNQVASTVAPSEATAVVGAATPPAPAPAPAPATAPPAAAPAALPAEELPIPLTTKPVVARTYARGTARRDVLIGTNGPDSLRGLAGNDRLAGLGSGDLLFGGAGNDLITGGSGRDRIDGGPGKDRLIAADGAADRISCGTGRDIAIVDEFDVVDASCEQVIR